MKMKSLLSLILVALILMGNMYINVSYAAIDDTIFSDTVKTKTGASTSAWYSLNTFTKVLRFTGTGDMPDYDSGGATLWSGTINGEMLAKYIETVYFDQGITRIGSSTLVNRGHRDGPYTDSKYYGPTKIYIADSVTSIGYGALNDAEIYIFGMQVSFDTYAISTGATIYGYSGSTAQSYAKSRGISFKLLCEEHNTEFINFKESACAQLGYTGDYVCTVCGATLEKGVKTASLGHDYQLTNNSEPTCTEAGYTGDSVCTRCGKIESTGQNINALGHDWNGWNVLNNPTCEEKGEVIRFCSRCDEYETKNVDVLGHNWGDAQYEWSSDNSTCSAKKICKRDISHIETETVTATSKVIKEPTTTSTGTDIYTAKFNNTDFETQTKTVTLDKLPDNIKEFPDIKKGSWYYDAVQYVAKAGFMSGYQNGNFGPGDNLKRQDFVVILANVAGANFSSYASSTPKLKDVKKGAYYAAAVNWAVDNGIIAGYANGNFGVNDNLTREQVATILYRYMKSPEVKNIDSTLAKFKDVNRVSSFAKTAVAWAVQNNVISGMADGRVAPTEGAARAQIASIIMRMDQQGMFDKS